MAPIYKVQHEIKPVFGLQLHTKSNFSYKTEKGSTDMAKTFKALVKLRPIFIMKVRQWKYLERISKLDNEWVINFG